MFRAAEELRIAESAHRSAVIEVTVAQIDIDRATASANRARANRDEGTKCVADRRAQLDAAATPAPGAGTAVPPPAPPVPGQTAPGPRGPMPKATRFETGSGFSSASDPGGNVMGQSMRVDLTYFENGSVTGTLTNYSGAVLGSLVGTWQGDTAGGRISLSDDVLRAPGSGGMGMWEITFSAVGRPVGAWCITSRGAKLVARQFGMLSLLGFPVVNQRSTTDPLCQ